MRKRTQASGVKRELARDVEKAMKRAGIDRNELARRSGTSRAQVDRVLDPVDESVRLTTFAKVVRVVHPTLRLGLARGPARAPTR